MKKVLFCLFFFMFSIFISAEPLKVNYAQTGQRFAYQIELLALALEKTANTDGEYILDPIVIDVTKGRMLHMFKNNRFDVLWMATTSDREKDFLPVRIPLLQGILGYRIFLINKEDINDFAAVKDFKDLKVKYDAGFGSHWADRKILEYNGIRIIHTPLYENLFKMLSAGRFDYFPRGIDEVWLEYEERKSKYPNMEIEKTLGFYYPYPYYFFVNKNNQVLADRIERGLEAALTDGAFKKLFNKYYGEYINKAYLERRTIFFLENPDLPPGTESPDTSWWQSEAE
jgi:ABC-type amino acid transport substrate-binding protein